MPTKPIDRTGWKVGKLTVLEFAGYTSYNKPLWKCICSCKYQTILYVTSSNLSWVKGCRHCGIKPRTHGMSSTPEYNTWIHIRQRCTNDNLWDYKHYGGRGVKCLFDTFEQFYAEVGPRPSPKHSIDRINNNWHYAPGNVRWATVDEQAKNRNPKGVIVQIKD